MSARREIEIIKAFQSSLNFLSFPLPVMDRLALENNAISVPADPDTLDTAVGAKAAIMVMIKIFLIIVIVVNHPIIVVSIQAGES
jgi:hypothetical protein